MPRRHNAPMTDLRWTGPLFTHVSTGATIGLVFFPGILMMVGGEMVWGAGGCLFSGGLALMLSLLAALIDRSLEK